MVLGPDGVCIVAPQAKNDNDNDGPIVPASAAGEGQGLGGAWYKGDEEQMLNDPEAYIAAAKRGAAIGIEGKLAIHPSQIELANKVFSPPETEVNKAKRILEELDKAAKEGKGAAQLDGRMIDAASARMAENIVSIDKLINKK